MMCNGQLSSPKYGSNGFEDGLRCDRDDGYPARIRRKLEKVSSGIVRDVDTGQVFHPKVLPDGNTRIVPIFDKKSVKWSNVTGFDAACILLDCLSVNDISYALWNTDTGDYMDNREWCNKKYASKSSVSIRCKTCNHICRKRISRLRNGEGLSCKCNSLTKYGTVKGEKSTRRSWVHEYSQIQNNIPDHLRVAISEEEFERTYTNCKTFHLPVKDQNTGETLFPSFKSLLHRKKLLDVDKNVKQKYERSVKWSSLAGFEAAQTLIDGLSENGISYVLWNKSTKDYMIRDEWCSQSYVANSTISIVCKTCNHVCSKRISRLKRGEKLYCKCSGLSMYGTVKRGFSTKKWVHRYHLIQESIPDHLCVAISEEEFVKAYNGAKFRLPVVDQNTGEMLYPNMQSLLVRKKVLKLDVKARQKYTEYHIEKSKVSVQQNRVIGDIRSECRRAFWHCKNARQEEETFNLKLDDIYQMLDFQGGVCALSKITFDTKRDYLRPSIDAIDPSRGHSIDNCHLVLKVVNYAKNRLTVRELIRVLAGESSIFYERPNNSKTKQVWHVVDLCLPLNMTPRQTFAWKALMSLPCEPVSRTVVQQYINENLSPPINFDKQITQNILNKFVNEGYVEKITCSNGRDIRYLQNKQPLLHPKIYCGACRAELPPSQIQLRLNRADKFAPLNGNPSATNQTRNTCRDCRTKNTTKCRNRDRASYVWAKLCSRKNGRKDGDIEKEHLLAMCEIDVCPIAGIRLSYESGWSPNQASPDRIDNEDGYTKKNVRIVSLLANYARQRTDVTDDELRDVLCAVRNVCQKFNKCNTIE
jgi:hypothetical protein